ncbi:hypothetical protein C8A03DRAFT_15779, partial [Achaetomium macrosporum]
RTSKSRGHFAIFIPNASDIDQTPSKGQPCKGTVIHVVGNPLRGFYHEFKRSYNPYDELRPMAVVPLGYIQHPLVLDPSTDEYSTDQRGMGAHDAAALQVPPPGQSDVRAPVDGVIKKYSQDWAIEYVQHLVGLGYLDSSAVQLLQEQRDPPTHGVMLRRGDSHSDA